jgi:hypothetical protein
MLELRVAQRQLDCRFSETASMRLSLTKSATTLLQPTLSLAKKEEAQHVQEMTLIPIMAASWTTLMPMETHFI